VTLACADTGRSTKLIEDVALRISADEGPFLLSSIFFVDESSKHGGVNAIQVLFV